LIALRLIWVFPGAYLAHLIGVRVLGQETTTPTLGGILVVGWTGMRGVISLAAAIALPQTLANGAPFMQRNLVIFLAFCVILVTLVFQGLTLPRLTRLLGLAGAPSRNMEEEEARRRMLEAALAYLEESRSQDEGKFDDLYADLTGHYQQRLNAVTPDSPDNATPEIHQRLSDISRELLRVERETAVRLRNEGRINDQTLRELEHELDLREAGPPHAL
jgi:CPA1 family monovalent cation:H+ antiporter